MRDIFNKIEQKTNINKETILKLADKLQKNNMKDENTIREIVNAIKNDKVPKNLDKML